MGIGGYVYLAILKSLKIKCEGFITMKTQRVVLYSIERDPDYRDIYPYQVSALPDIYLYQFGALPDIFLYRFGALPVSSPTRTFVLSSHTAS